MIRELNTKANSIALLAEVIAQAFQHRGLARAYLAGKHDETFTRLNPVDQIRQRLFMLFTAIKNVGSGLRLNGSSLKPKNAR